MFQEGLREEDKYLNLAYLSLLLLLLGIGIYLRGYNLSALSFWVDEYTHVFAAKSILAEGLPLLPSEMEYKRALPFTYLVALSFKLFGISEFSARLPSVIFSTLTIFALYWVGAKFLNKTSGLIAATLFTFSPLCIEISRWSRMYALFQLLYLFLVYTFYKGFDNKEKTYTDRATSWWESQGISIFWLLISAIFFAFSFLIHSLTVLFIPTIVVYALCLFLYISYQESLKKALISKYFVFLLLLGLFSILFTLWVKKYSIFYDFIRLLTFRPAWTEGNIYNYRMYAGFLRQNYFPLAYLFALGSLFLLWREKRKGLFLILCFSVPFLLQSFISWKGYRFIVYIMPLFFLVASFGIEQLFAYIVTILQRFGWQLKNSQKDFIFIKVPLFFIMLAFLLAISPWFKAALQVNQRSHPADLKRSNWRNACLYVKKHWVGNEAIIASVPLAAIYYLGKADYTLSYEAKARDQAMDSDPQKDRKTGTILIPNLKVLQSIIQKHNNGWIIIDNYIYSSGKLNKIKDFIQTNLHKHQTIADSTMHIYSWGID
jgi:4-amino-4-deoxy-L-arabinose transferase-like glycosyltransferase